MALSKEIETALRAETAQRIERSHVAWLVNLIDDALLDAASVEDSEEAILAFVCGAVLARAGRLDALERVEALDEPIQWSPRAGAFRESACVLCGSRLKRELARCVRLMPEAFCHERCWQQAGAAEKQKARSHEKSAVTGSDNARVEALDEPIPYVLTELGGALE